MVGCQVGAADGGAQLVPERAMVLRIVSRVWATAVSAAFRGLPASTGRNKNKVIVQLAVSS